MSALATTRLPRYKKCLYLYPVASMTSDEAWGGWFGVRSSIVSVLFSVTVRPAGLKAVPMTAIMFAKPSADLDTMPASSVYITYYVVLLCVCKLVGQPSPRHRPLRGEPSPQNIWVLTETYQQRIRYRTEAVTTHVLAAAPE